MRCASDLSLFFGRVRVSAPQLHSLSEIGCDPPLGVLEWGCLRTYLLAIPALRTLGRKSRKFPVNMPHIHDNIESTLEASGAPNLLNTGYTFQSTKQRGILDYFSDITVAAAFCVEMDARKENSGAAHGASALLGNAALQFCVSLSWLSSERTHYGPYNRESPNLSPLLRSHLTLPLL